MANLRIAGAQMSCVVGDQEGNVRKACEYIDKASQSGANIICFPEAFVTGYSLSYIRDNCGSSDIHIETLAKKALSCGIAVVAGVPRSDGRKIYNSAILIDKLGMTMGTYDKIHLFSMQELYERDYFERGQPNYQVYDIESCKIGLSICYDLRFPEMSRKLALNGADLIISVAAWPKKRLYQFRTVSASRAIENQLFVFSVNRVGTDGDTIFGGNTTLYDPLGYPVFGSVDHDEESLVLVDLDLNSISETRNTLKCFEDRLRHYDL